jgi:hypothetical protein
MHFILLESALLQELDAKAAKQARRKGREKARVVAQKGRRFQEEKRKIVEQITTQAQYRTVPGLDR